VPFVLHPSGYCVWFNENSGGNLITGAACPICRRTAGHHPECLYYKDSDVTGASSRPKLYNATSILWAKNPVVYFITFTLPSRPGLKTYQASPRCPDTGDLAVTSKFSQCLDAIRLHVKRKKKNQRISYTWVAEIQMKRKAKYGGPGDLHFHLVTDQRLPVKWLRALWHGYFPDCNNTSGGGVDIKVIPTGVDSVPAYLAKYLGKGSDRRLFCRRFARSRDLSSLVPVHLSALPASLEPIRTTIVSQANGYETALYYFNTREILEEYGAAMMDEKKFQVTRGGREFTAAAIASRKFNREIKQNKKRYAETVGLLPF
jgi:hypothetical protein